MSDAPDIHRPQSPPADADSPAAVRRPSGSRAGSPGERPKKSRIVAALESPYWAGIGVMATLVLGFLLTLYQGYSAGQRARLQSGVQLLYEWNRLQPPNSVPCLALGAKLPPGSFQHLLDRRSIELPAALEDAVIACFSDLDPVEIAKLYADHKLSVKGSYLLWHRMDGALEADNLAATFVLRGMADEMLLEEEIGRDICRDDPIVLAEINKIKGYETSFSALKVLTQKLKYPGCGPAKAG
jgi:hypothetical protein